MEQVQKHNDSCQMILSASDFIESFCPDLDSENQAWRCVAMQLAYEMNEDEAAIRIKNGLKEAVKSSHTNLEFDKDSAVDDVLLGYVTGELDISKLRESVKTH